jgi:hypothetical protein
MSMSAPKNTTTKDYVLCGMSGLGACLSAYAVYKGPSIGATISPQFMVNCTSLPNAFMNAETATLMTCTNAVAWQSSHFSF